VSKSTVVNYELILGYLQHYCDRERIIGCDHRHFYQHTQKFALHFQQYSTPPSILLVEPDPFRFLSIFIAAVATHSPLFLGHPRWQEQEWNQVLETIQPDLILGNALENVDLKPQNLQKKQDFSVRFHPKIRNLIAIPTGGTSGTIKFCLHSWKTLTESVIGFSSYFKKTAINSFCILPLSHVSGLMQFLRSFMTEGYFYFYSYKDLKSKNTVSFKQKDFFVSLVPTQLQFFLNRDPQWLARFDTVLLGGAPAGSNLLETARKHQIRLAPTYGMTETASQIVTLKPDDFLEGNNSSGRVLPHAAVKILNPDHQKVGRIAIASKSLCLGYHSNGFDFSSPYLTDDLGYFDDRGYLHIIGRNSSKIITGGENVFPAEVEAAILATQLVVDVCVIGLPDETWGEAVTAVYVPKDVNVSVRELKAALELKIGKFKQPKNWIKVPELPSNEQGKVNRQTVKSIAFQFLNPDS
jgi:O-succinylbenzoic acid--CoA ligase